MISCKKGELKERRIKLLMTQEQMATSVGCTINTVVNWEKADKIKMRYLSALQALENGTGQKSPGRPKNAPKPYRLYEPTQRHAMASYFRLGPNGGEDDLREIVGPPDRDSGLTWFYNVYHRQTLKDLWFQFAWQDGQRIFVALWITPSATHVRHAQRLDNPEPWMMALMPPEAEEMPAAPDYEAMASEQERSLGIAWDKSWKE